MDIIVIAIIGDVSSGKKTVADYFINNHGFYALKNVRDDNLEYLKEDEVTLGKLSIVDEESTDTNSDLDSINSKNTTIVNKHIPIKLRKSSLKEKIKNLKEKKIVIYPFVGWEDFLELRNKTSFRLINMASCAKKRFANYMKKNPEGKLDDFFDLDSSLTKEPGYIQLKMQAFSHIINEGSIEDLEFKLSKLKSAFTIYFRPSWDDYFMSVAHILADRSNCIKQKVGSILIKNNRIVSTGYNGTPHKIENCYQGGCERCNDIEISQGKQLDECFCLHAEENAVLEAGRMECTGAVIYTTVYPCLMCAKIIVECGINKVVYDKDYNSDLTRKIFEMAKIDVIKWNQGFDKFL